MSRGNVKFNTAANNDEIIPILLVRILNIQPKDSSYHAPQSLYLTGCQENVSWYDEQGNLVNYLASGVKFESCEVTTDNPVSTGQLTIDNVNRTFSAMAQYYLLNGVEVHVLRAFSSTLNSPDGAQLVMLGHLKKVVINESAISADIWCDFSLRVKIPRRLYSTNLFPYLPTSKDVRSIFTG